MDLENFNRPCSIFVLGIIVRIIGGNIYYVYTMFMHLCE